MQQTVRSSAKVSVPGVGCAVGVVLLHPPCGGEDLKCVAVKLLSLVAAQTEATSKPCEEPTTLQFDPS